MGVAVGIDVAKDFHWVRAIDHRDSELLLDRRVDNAPAALAAFVDELNGSRPSTGADGRHRRRRRHRQPVDGDAAEARIEVVHVSGLAVNRAREGTIGGEHKSDPRDAGVIADQVRHRRDLRAIEPSSEIDAEIRLLVGRRRELVGDQTRRINRLRDLLASIYPGLERVVDPTTRPASSC